QAELQYLHENAGINDSNGLTVKHVVNFSGVVGNNTIALGANISFDTAIGVGNNTIALVLISTL
ncbi:mitochondrial outer membrane protein porin of 36 kDa, partial [Tanacetum coccineum]